MSLWWPSLELPSWCIKSLYSFEGEAPIDFIYGCPIFKWVAGTWLQDRVPGPPFTKRMDVLPQDLAKSRSSEIQVWTFPITPKFDRHLGSTAACQISEPYDHYNTQSRGLKTLRDLSVRRITTCEWRPWIVAPAITAKQHAQLCSFLSVAHPLHPTSHIWTWWKSSI